MGVSHTTQITSGTDSGDGRISKNAWNETHTGTNDHGHTGTGDGGQLGVITLPETWTWITDYPNGVFNALGYSYGASNGQTGVYLNPAGGGTGLYANGLFTSPVGLTVTQSSDQDGTRVASKALDHSVDPNDGCSHTQSIANSWWKVDFGSGHTFTPTRLGICGRASGGLEPRNFKLQGSNDNSTWTDLLTVTNDGPADNAWWSSTVSGSSGYRYLRIYETGANSGGSDYLILGEVEMWGTLA